MSNPDMLNYFDSPNKSRSGNDDKLVIGGSINANGDEFEAEDFRRSLAFNYGLWDYSDLTTATTPITVLADTQTLLTNDGQGAFSTSEYGIIGVDVYNENTNAFNFSDLSLGDSVGIRIDCTVNTNNNNEELLSYMTLGSGLSSYNIPWTSSIQYKTAGSHRLTSYNKIYIRDEDTKNSPAQVYIQSTGNCTVTVHGWFLEVFKR